MLLADQDQVLQGSLWVFLASLAALRFTLVSRWTLAKSKFQTSVALIEDCEVHQIKHSNNP